MFLIVTGVALTTYISFSGENLEPAPGIVTHVTTQRAQK